MSSAVPTLYDIVTLVLAQDAVMRGIEPQQTGEMRVDAQPLRSKDAQNMRMSHQQHIVADVQQRQYSFDGVPGTRGGLLHVLARTVMHRNLLAGRQCLNPITFKAAVWRARRSGLANMQPGSKPFGKAERKRSPADSACSRPVSVNGISVRPVC